VKKDRKKTDKRETLLRDKCRLSNRAWNFAKNIVTFSGTFSQTH